MAAPKNYKSRYITAVAMEQSEKDLMGTLGITHSEAHRIGLHVLIEQRIMDSDPRVTPEVIGQFAELKKTIYKEIEAYVRLQKTAQTTLETMKNIVGKEQELVEVWDVAEEAYVRIPRQQQEMHPEVYILKGVAKA